MTCVWTPDPDMLGPSWASLPQHVRERALLLATGSLQTLTNRRVGECPRTVRQSPEPRPCNHDWVPHQFDGDGFFLNACGCRTARWSRPMREIVLEGPVGYIDEIKVDGAAMDLDLDQWRLDNGNILVWQGLGASPLPACQNLDLPDTEVGTWSITYSPSHPVSREGEIAVAALAVEFVKAMMPTAGECGLPRGVTNVTRQGVSFTISAGLFPNGLTGIDVVDAFILQWAPPGSPQATAKVMSPRDLLAKANRRTGALPVRGTPFIPTPSDEQRALAEYEAGLNP